GCRDRTEDVALDATQREQRHETRDDDGGRKEDRPAHFAAGVEDRGERTAQAPAPVVTAVQVGRTLGEMPEYVLDHDDGGIDDQAEVDRADRKQVRRIAPHQHDALDDIVIAVLSDDAEPRLITDGDDGDIAHQHRQAALLGQHGLADVIDRSDQPDSAHHRGLLADVERLSTYIDVRVVERLDDLSEREAV